MDTKLRRKPRVDVSLTKRQQQERERLIRMKRNAKPMPMQINGSLVRRTGQGSTLCVASALAAREDPTVFVSLEADKGRREQLLTSGLPRTMVT